MFKNVENFRRFLERYCRYEYFDFSAYLDELVQEDGETHTEDGLHFYELSQFESKTKRPELFDYETETDENGEKIFIF